MYFFEFTQKLKKGDLPALTLLFGDAEGVIAEGSRLFRERFRSAFPQGSVLSFDAQEGGLERALDAARAISLFATEQLVLLHRADKGIGGTSDAGVGLLKSYIKDPNPSTHLLFLAPGAKASSKTVRAVERMGWVVQCAELRENQVAEWAKAMALEKGLSLTEGAGRLLVERTGGDPAYLRTALDQLSLALHPGKKAQEKDVAELPIPGNESGIFELQDQVGARRSGKALMILDRLGEGVDMGTVVMLYLRIRDLLAMAGIRSEGGGPGDAAQRLGMHPYRVNGLWEQAGRFSKEELKEALKGIIALQEGIVTGRFGKDSMRTVVERWILRWGKG